MKLNKSSWMYRWVLKVEAAKSWQYTFDHYDDKEIVDRTSFVPYDKCQFFRVAFLYPAICFSLLVAGVSFAIWSVITTIGDVGFMNYSLGVGLMASVIVGVLAAVALFLLAVHFLGQGSEAFGLWLGNKIHSSRNKKRENKFCSYMEYVDDEK